MRRPLAKVQLCRVFFQSTRQNNQFAECFYPALGKIISLPSVFPNTWQIQNLFSSPALQTFSTIHLQHVLLHVKIWYISESI